MGFGVVMMMDDGYKYKYMFSILRTNNNSSGVLFKVYIHSSRQIDNLTECIQ